MSGLFCGVVPSSFVLMYLILPLPFSSFEWKRLKVYFATYSSFLFYFIAANYGLWKLRYSFFSNQDLKLGSISGFRLWSAK